MAKRGLYLCALLAALTTCAEAAVPQTAGIAPSRAVGATHDCSGFYPDMSRRLSESGDVLIGYDVAADGTISNVVVAHSSGVDRLDAAAVQCVARHWRNTPAMQDGVPVASPGHQAIIRFSLDYSDGIGTPEAVLPGAAGIPGWHSDTSSLPDTPARGDAREPEPWESPLWILGTLALLGWIVAGLRRWVFRARTCPVCNARNRSVVPFRAPAYCSSCTRPLT